MPTSPTSSPTAPHVRTPSVDAWRIEVFRKPERDDPDGLRAPSALRELGVIAADLPLCVRVGKGYLLSPGLSAAQIERIARELLVDPVLETARIVAPRGALRAERKSAHRLLVMRRPGVMDP